MPDRKSLDKLYEKYSRRELVYPDPVGFLYDFENVADREIVGLIASSLAYGRVQQINKSVGSVLEKIKPSPLKFIERVTREKLFNIFKGFKHRFTTDEELSLLIYAAKIAIEKHGSLENCFLSGFKNMDETVFPALDNFSKELMCTCDICKNSLIPMPGKGSACKRQNLYLRWMIRQDNIDPGGWNNALKSKLIMPIDTHIHKVSMNFGFTVRKNADMLAALEITNAFRKLNPDDPVKYDFALTRSSILNDNDLKKILK
ncbi:MAG: TIGR02757 family protein [Cyanobacteriota bacterium]